MYSICQDHRQERLIEKQPIKDHETLWCALLWCRERSRDRLIIWIFQSVLSPFSKNVDLLVDMMFDYLICSAKCWTNYAFALYRSPSLIGCIGRQEKMHQNELVWASFWIHFQGHRLFWKVFLCLILSHKVFWRGLRKALDDKKSYLIEAKTDSFEPLKCKVRTN